MEPIEWAIGGAILLFGAGSGYGAYKVLDKTGDAIGTVAGGVATGASDSENTVANGGALFLGLAGAAVLVYAYQKSKGR